MDAILLKKNSNNCYYNTQMNKYSIYSLASAKSSIRHLAVTVDGKRQHEAGIGRQYG